MQKDEDTARVPQTDRSAGTAAAKDHPPSRCRRSTTFKEAGPLIAMVARNAIVAASGKK